MKRKKFSNPKVGGGKVQNRPGAENHPLFCWSLLLGICLLPSVLLAQESLESRAGKSVEDEVAESWASLQTRTKDFSPEERIAAVDQWQISEKSKLDEIRQKRIQAAKQATPAPSPVRIPVTELDRVNAAIEKEFQPIWAAELTPEEHIRQVDAALKKTASLQADRMRLLREANAKTPKATPIPPDSKTPEGRLAIKSREILELTKGMSAEDRIAAIDSMKSELDALLKDVRLSKKQPADPSATPNPSTH